MNDVDAIVIGSGQGGVPLAVDWAREGKRVVLFEGGALGGSCINYGCTPSKAFLAPVHTAARARLAEPMGVRGSVGVDFGAVMERARSIVASFREGVGKRLAAAGVHVVHAEASFCGTRTVRAGSEEYRAPLLVIDTGTSALIPDVKGLAQTPYLDNKSFFDQMTLPQSMIVMGGGYIGLELGQGMARAGSRVTIVDRNDRVLAREDGDASEALEKGLRRDGIELRLRRTVESVRHDASGFMLLLNGGETLSAEALLVAVGRKPNTEALNAGASSIELDKRGMVRINERFETSCPGVYAIGDVAGQPAFTHVSWEDYRRVKAVVGGGNRTRSDRVLAYSTYTEPQVARAGKTLDEARDHELDARAVTLPITSIARATEWGQELGFYRLVVDNATEKILGAVLVGYETAELVHVIVAHMEAGSTWRVLERSVHIHPTYAEGLPSLARLLA